MQLHMTIITIMKIIHYYHYEVNDVQHGCENLEENTSPS